MIITKFNNYFDKHGKVTYLVLCIIIAVIFVFTIGSGDAGCMGNERLTSFGSMYGRDLSVDVVQRKIAQLRLWHTMHGQQVAPGVGDYEMLQMVLQKMRLVHEAQERGLAEVTAEDLAKAIVDLPYWSFSEKDHTGDDMASTETGYTQKRFKNFLEVVVKGRYGLSGEDFDEMMKDSILEKRVLEDAVKGIEADEQTVKLVAADSTLWYAEYKLRPEDDSRPAYADIAKFLKERSKELTAEDRMENFFLVAYGRYDETAQRLSWDKQLPKYLTPSDKDVEKRFNRTKDTEYKGKKLAEVKAEIKQAMTLANCKAYVDGNVRRFNADLKKAKVKGYTEFKRLASKHQLKVAEQNGIPGTDEISGIAGAQKDLAAALKGVKKLNAPTDVVVLVGDKANDGKAVAMKVSNPNRSKHMEDAVADILREEKALVMYQEKIVKPYAGAAKGAKNMEAFFASQMKKIQPDMTDPASWVDLINEMERLNNVILPFFEEKDGKVVLRTLGKRDADLLRWYNREVSLEKTRQRAATAQARAAKALKAGKKLTETGVRFQKVNRPLSWFKAVRFTTMMMQQQMQMYRMRLTPMLQNGMMAAAMEQSGSILGLPVKNLPALISALDKAGDKVLLPEAVRGSEGYLVVYQEARALPTDEEGTKEVEAAREQVKEMLKAKAIRQLLTELEAASNTQLVEEILPREKETEEQ